MLLHALNRWRYIQPACSSERARKLHRAVGLDAAGVPTSTICGLNGVKTTTTPHCVTCEVCRERIGIPESD